MRKDSNDTMLFQDFTPPTKQEWIEKATIDLKGADFDRKLVWKNLNGMEIEPFYTREDLEATLSNTGENSDSIVNYRRIIVTDGRESNQLALKAIEEGMTGILFEIRSKVLPEELLQHLDFEEISVSFQLDKYQLSFTEDLKTYFEDHAIDPKVVKGYIDLDIFNNYLEMGMLDLDLLQHMADLTNQFQAYPRVKTLVVSGTVYQDAGSNQVQEIAYTLNSLVFLLDEMTKTGLTPSKIFENLHFILGISSDYFVEIAKFRVFKSLVASIATKYGNDLPETALTAKTSLWSKSVTDAHTNMLRTTTEAMSALLGNADGIELDPYDRSYQNPGDFSYRIAGNITTILKEESYFGKVANPVDGSYYVEALSLKMADNALDIFKGIESEGGFYQAVENETIQTQIDQIKLKKISSLSQRRQAMVGVNKYPNLMESVSEDILDSTESPKNEKVLKRQRAGIEMERIRYSTEHFVTTKGFRPSVEIASYGQLTMRKARAAFAYDFMGVSGFEIQSEKSFNSYREAAEKTAASNSNVVVICSSDPDYLESAVDFVREFRAANSSKILLLAGYPDQIQEALVEAGLDGFIHVRSDIFKTLTEIQQNISKTIKHLEI